MGSATSAGRFRVPFVMLVLVVLAALAAGCMPIAAPAPAESAPAESAPAESEGAQADIVDTAVGAGNFTTLVAAVQGAGLVDALKGEGPFTVFAPSDEAFAKIPQETIDALLADPSGDLTQILLYHVVPGLVLSSDLQDGMMATTLQGSDVTIHLGDGGAMVNDANIVAADVLASNGVIHVIDTVIMPPAEEATEEATSEEATSEEAAADEMSASADIVDTAVGAGNFTTLVAAVQAAGLVDALKGEGPFTVFAPSDEAFAKIPQETIDALLADPSGDLTQILLYHVVPGAVLSSDLSDGMAATTLQGSDVMIHLGEGVTVNDANVVAADVMASNGVIHVIDTVLMPPSE